MKTFGKIFKVTVNVILAMFLLVGALVIFSSVALPGGYKIFTVQSGSMEPTIKTGSVIFTKSTDSYEKGDVVTRRTTQPKVTITHRIYEKTISAEGETIFKTKGDANEKADTEFFSKDAIIGKAFLNIPYLGYPVGYAKTEQGLILLIIIPAVIIVYDEMNNIKKEIRKIMRHRKKKKKAEDKDIEEQEVNLENKNQ